MFQMMRHTQEQNLENIKNFSTIANSDIQEQQGTKEGTSLCFIFTTQYKLFFLCWIMA